MSPSERVLVLVAKELDEICPFVGPLVVVVTADKPEPTKVAGRDATGEPPRMADSIISFFNACAFRIGQGFRQERYFSQ